MKALGNWWRDRRLRSKVGAGLVLAAASAAVVVRGVVRPLGRVSQVLHAVAEGDLTRTVGLATRDEIGVLATDVDRAVASMRGTVEVLTRSSATLGDAADRLGASTAVVERSARQVSGHRHGHGGRRQPADHRRPDRDEPGADPSNRMIPDLKDMSEQSPFTVGAAHPFSGIAITDSRRTVLS